MVEIYNKFLLLISIGFINCSVVENSNLLRKNFIENVNNNAIIDLPIDLEENNNFQLKNLSFDDSTNFELKRYHGDQLWRIIINDEDDRDIINELRKKYDGQTWMDINNNVDMVLKQTSLEDAEKLLKSSNLPYIVLIDDLQKAIDSENPPKEEIEILQNRKGHRMTWIAYHRMADIYSYMDYLTKTYPKLCSVETLGYSTLNQPIKLLKISNKNTKNRRIFIDGGIHAREWISPATVTYIIESLTDNWDNQPAYMKNIDWHIIPVLNPDGYEHTHEVDRLWRKNRSRGSTRQCSGVDLNRNFGYNWGGAGTSASGCSDIYRGTRAFSEPETAAMANYMMKFGKGYFQGYITFHSYGQYVLYPWGHKRVLTPDYKELERVGKEGAANMLKVGGVSFTVGSSAMTLYPAAGGSDDWAKAALDIKYTYTVEMRDTGRYGFILPAQFILTSGKEGLAFTETVARAAVLL